MTVRPTAARAIAVDVLVHGPQSRAQLAKKTGLSPATLTRLVRPLVDDGVLVEADAVRGPGRGRSSVPLDVPADGHSFVGVKLTTESIYAVVTNLRAEVSDRELLDEPSLDVTEVVSAVSALIRRLAARATAPVRAVGVTVGGQVDADGTVRDSPFLNWHDVPFGRLLGREVPHPVHLANDVVGLTRAQQWFGYGRTEPDFALVTVGAGVGYGLVLDGEVVPTASSPISHLPVDPHGPVCALGHRGCMTAYLTSRAMTAAAGQALGRQVPYEELLALAESEEPVARRVVDEAAYALGRAVTLISSVTGVRQVILSGEGVRLADVGAEALERGRREYALGAAATLRPIVRPMDFWEWARGAAAIAIQSAFASA